jgi:hypothetical protein
MTGRPETTSGEPSVNHVLPESNNKHYPSLFTAPTITTGRHGFILRWAENIKYFNA